MMRRMLMCDVRVFGSILLIRFDFIDRKNVRECSEVRKADGSQNSSRVISPSKDVIRMSMSSRKIKYELWFVRNSPSSKSVAVDSSLMQGKFCSNIGPIPPLMGRSEERRGGNECVRTCRSRWTR